MPTFFALRAEKIAASYFHKSHVVRLYIYNPAGQPVYFNTLGGFSGTFSDRIDIANGVRGTYFLELRQGQQRLTRKIILQ